MTIEIGDKLQTEDGNVVEVKDIFKSGRLDVEVLVGKNYSKKGDRLVYPNPENENTAIKYKKLSG